MRCKDIAAWLTLGQVRFWWQVMLIALMNGVFAVTLIHYGKSPYGALFLAFCSGLGMGRSIEMGGRDEASR